MTRYYKSFKPGRVGPYSKVKWPERIGAWVKVEERTAVTHGLYQPHCNSKVTWRATNE